MSWHDYHDYDYEDCKPDWRTLRHSTHTARTPHHCDTCNFGIQPGQRYQVLAALNEGAFEITRHHVHGECQFPEHPQPGPAWQYECGPDETPF